MSFIGIILLFIFLYYVVRPLVKAWMAYRKLRNGDFSVFGEFFGQPGSQKHTSARNADGTRKAGWTKPVIKKKKISSDVGEYVKFTEIRTETTTTIHDDPTSSSDFTIEQQITDVEWEDIK